MKKESPPPPKFASYFPLFRNSFELYELEYSMIILFWFDLCNYYTPIKMHEASITAFF